MALDRGPHRYDFGDTACTTPLRAGLSGQKVV
jgi:predicted alternative tryptophan synthase beta-subunit